MRVDYTFVDKGDSEWDIEAEVHPINLQRIQILTIRGADGVELDLGDFDEEEQRDILWGAKNAAQELDSIEDDDEEESTDEDESNWESY